MLIKSTKHISSIQIFDREKVHYKLPTQSAGFLKTSKIKKPKTICLGTFQELADGFEPPDRLITKYTITFKLELISKEM